MTLILACPPKYTDKKNLKIELEKHIDAVHILSLSQIKKASLPFMVVLPPRADHSETALINSFTKHFEQKGFVRVCGVDDATVVAAAQEGCPINLDWCSPVSWGAVERIAERILSAWFAFSKPKPHFGLLYGESAAMQPVYKKIRIYAKEPDAVLIQADTGTGKELVAQALHTHSGRKGKLVVVNCASLHPDRVEADLFGHVRGAFSGATADRKGYIRQADRGTLFLDEFGELPPEVQAQLLRALENGEVSPLGSDASITTTTRYVLATNKHMGHEVAEQRFRNDLMNRVHLHITLPPLHQRMQDMGLLATHFLGQYAEEEAPVAVGCLDVLHQHRRIGNLRELRGVIRKAAMHSRETGRLLDRGCLQEAIQERIDFWLQSGHESHDGQDKKDVNTIPFSTGQTWKEVEHNAFKIYSEAQLEECGSVDRAAKQAGIARATFYSRRMKPKKGDAGEA